ncbi:hypothetical protein BGZ81_004212, partial [Podila clonocystis]
MSLAPAPLDPNMRLIMLAMEPEEPKDELEDFATAKPGGAFGPTDWWRLNDRSFPRLAKMAHDFLAIPTTSASSERAFSKARALIPYYRNKLGASKIRQLMLLES